LLRRPEEIGRAAFRPIREEAQFPALKPAETIEEIDNRLSSILPVAEIEQAPPQQPMPGGSGSILEPPTPPTPPVVELGAVTPVTPPPPQLMPEAAMPVAPITAPPEQPPAPPTTSSPAESTPAPLRPVITLAVSPSQPTPPPPQPDNLLMRILQALTEPGAGIDRDYGPSFDRGWGYEGPAIATGSFGSTGGYSTPSFEVGERFFGDWGFDTRYS
jgi:hypothetical protein